MSLLDDLNPVSGISKALFGDKGIAGGIVDTLKSTGVIKDSEAEERARQALREYDIKLENIENKKAEIINDKLRIINDNIKSAREREIAVKDKTPSRLAYVLVVGFIGISFLQLFALITRPDVAAQIPPQGWLLIGNISGYLYGEAKHSTSYYFGSTLGSSEKNDTIKEALKKSGE